MSGTLLMLVFDDEVDDVAEDEPDDDDEDELWEDVPNDGLKLCFPLLLLFTTLFNVTFISFSEGEIIPAADVVCCVNVFRDMRGEVCGLCRIFSPFVKVKLLLSA